MMSEMTLEEVRKEIYNLKQVERLLEKEEREKHKEIARRFIGKCYKRYSRAKCESDGVFCKIVSTPIETWTTRGTLYNQYQFPALFLQFPEKLGEHGYNHENIDEFVPCYCDTIYLDVMRGHPGAILRDDEYFEEVTPEEFAAEFDKCMESFKEQIGISKPKPIANKYTCKHVYRTFEDLDGPQYWCRLYNKDCDNCQKDW